MGGPRCGRALAVAGDVSVGADVDALFWAARDAFGPATIVVNNAGVATFAPLTAISEEDYCRQMDTSLWGAIQTTQALAAQTDIDGASIINVSTGGTLQYLATAACTSRPRLRLRRSRSSPPRNSGHAASGSTASLPDGPTPKEHGRAAS